MYEALVESEIVSSMLDPKILKRAQRIQTYRSSQPNQASPNSTVYVDMPNDAFVDLTQAYLEFDVSCTNYIAEVAEVISYPWITAAGVAVDGTLANHVVDFMIFYDGYSAGPYTKATPSLTIQNDLNALPSIQAQGLSGFITVTNNLSQAVAILSIQNDGQYKFANNNDFPFIQIVGRDTGAGAFSFLTSMFPTVTFPGAPASPVLEYDSGSFIEEITIQINSNEIIKVPAYRLLHNIYTKLKNPDYRRTSGFIYESEQERELRFLPSGSSRRLIVPLYGIDLFNHVIPLSLVPGMTMRIQFQFADASKALTRANATQSYNVSNIRFQYHSVNYSPEVVTQVKNEIDTKGILLGFSQFFTYPFSLSGDGIIPINISVKRFQGIMAVMQQNDFVTNESNFEKNASFINNFLRTARLQIGNKYYPSDRLQSTNNDDMAEFYAELQRSFEFFKPYAREGIIWSNSSVAGLNYNAHRHTDMIFETSGRRDLPSFILSLFVDPYLEESFRHVHSSGVDTSGLNTINLELTGINVASVNTITVYAQFVGFLLLKRDSIVYNR